LSEKIADKELSPDQALCQQTYEAETLWISLLSTTIASHTHVMLFSFTSTSQYLAVTATALSEKIADKELSPDQALCQQTYEAETLWISLLSNTIASHTHVMLFSFTSTSPYLAVTSLTRWGRWGIVVDWFG
jgi:hypothetical protein